MLLDSAAPAAGVDAHIARPTMTLAARNDSLVVPRLSRRLDDAVAHVDLAGVDPRRLRPRSVRRLP